MESTVQKGQKLHKGRVYYINLLLERIILRKIGKNTYLLVLFSHFYRLLLKYFKFFDSICHLFV